MAKFFVGQRVRCVASETGECQGKEGRVIAVNYSRTRVDGSFITNGLLVEHGFRVPVLGEPWRWEPILPDGHRACDEDFKRDLDRMLAGEGLPA